MRRVLATFAVTTPVDVVDENDSLLSLREAINAANSSVGLDTITFDAGVFPASSETKIDLQLGQLDVTDSLEINGPGQSALTIDGQGNSRVFAFFASAADFTVSRLTITGGQTTQDDLSTSESGGGIRFASGGLLTLNEVAMSGNQTTGTGSRGGAIFAQPGNVVLNSSKVFDNQTLGSGARGGAIFMGAGLININDSSLSGNSTAGDNGKGGALYSVAGQVTLQRSQITDNHAAGASADGGAIFATAGVQIQDSLVSGNRTTGDDADGGAVFANGSVQVLSSDISNNRTEDDDSGGGAIASDNATVLIDGSSIVGNRTQGATSYGGGLFAVRSVVTIVGSTVANNQTTGTGSNGGGVSLALSSASVLASTVAQNTADGTGGGIAFFDNEDRTIDIQNSIVAANIDSGTAPDLQEPIDEQLLTVDFSLIGDNTGTNLSEADTPDAQGNLIGDPNSFGIIDPLLGSLLASGGTQVLPLLNGSPAIDAGDNSLVSSILTDQRGQPFARVADGTVDMGSFETQVVDPTSFVVTTADDELDFANADVSLREAIQSANGNAGADVISFDPSVFASIFTLTNQIDLQLGELSITDEVEIVGPGSGRLTIDAGGESRVLSISSLAGSVSLSGLTISGGSTTDSGAGIAFLSPGVLTLSDVAVTDNATSGSAAFGGGVYSQSGVIDIRRSLVSNNQTNGQAAHGGGLHSGGVLLATDTTFSGNTTLGAGAHGGGVFGDSAVQLSRSTLANNQAAGDSSNGGGMASRGSVDITNSTISQNSAGGSGGGLFTQASTGRHEIASSTIAANSSDIGGGISLDDDTATLVLINNSIVATNQSTSGPDIDASQYDGSLQLESSLIGDNADSSLAESQTADTLGNLIGSAVGTGVIDPLLGSLSLRGGQTASHSLLSGSPAIDAGDSLLLGLLDTDQRGDGFARENGVSTDMGAFETQPINPSLLVVNTTNDELDFSNDEISLREALEFADGSLGMDVITFDNTVFAQASQIDLTLGQLSIADSVSIEGPSAGLLTIDAQGNSRVIAVSGTADVSLSALVISGGVTTQDNQLIEGIPESTHNGGGIRFDSSGTLNLDGVVISDSRTQGVNARGGGLYASGGTVNIVDSIFADNTTEGESADGGGAYISGNQTSIVDTLFIDNTTEGDFAGGGGLSVSASDLSVVDSIFDGNATLGNNADGGGIEARDGGDLSVVRTIVEQNSTAMGNSDGGGIFYRDGMLSVLDSTIRGNSTTGDNASGGGISAGFAIVHVEQSAFVTNSTAGANGDGAGLAIEGSDVSIVNTTLSGNTTTGTDSSGGGITAGQGSVVNLLNSTVTLNSASGDGGGIHIAPGANESLNLSNTILAENLSGAVGADLLSPSNPVRLDVQFSFIGDNQGTALAEATTTDSKGNLIGDSTGDGLIDPLLGPLAINGGAVPTHKPLSGSPVSDSGSDALAVDADTNPLVNDGRGAPFSRFFGTVDMGAFESQPPNAATINWDTPANIFVGTALSNLQLNATADTPGTFTYTPTLGTVLSAGNSQTLMVSFIPDDNIHYSDSTASVTINVVEQADRGDAPDSYGTLVSSGGPSHPVGSLILGSAVDVEVDGQPNAVADGDDLDDDGVQFITSLVADSLSATTGTIVVDVSETGMLDAWIDFDGNGTFDMNEHIAPDGNSISVSSGTNRISITVPVGAAPGDTFARFRLSSDGGLLPTGDAVDGEVEDYAVQLLDATSPSTVDLQLPSGPITLFVDGSEFVVQRRTEDLFRAPDVAVGRYEIIGDEFSNVLTIDNSGGLAVPNGGLTFDGVDRVNTVRLVGSGNSIDISRGGNIELKNVSVIDISDPEVNSLRVDSRAARAMTPQGGGIIVVGSTGDTIEFADSEQWRMDDPIDVAGFSFSVITLGDTFIQVDFASAWQNLARPSDVNNDGNVTAVDALRIINELSRRSFSDQATSQLVNPGSVSPWPNTYFDQNGDGLATALDALRVINEISRQSNNQDNGEGELVSFVNMAAETSFESDSLVGPSTISANSTTSVSSFNTTPSLPTITPHELVDQAFEEVNEEWLAELLELNLKTDLT